MSDVQIPRPVKARHHIGQAISIRGLRAEVQRADGINAKIAGCRVAGCDRRSVGHRRSHLLLSRLRMNPPAAA